ncbi:MAG: SRPBCC family protein [Actinomycetota bacterium]
MIDRPVADVWNVIADLARTPEWRTTVTSVEPPETLAVGAEFDAATRVLGRTWSWRLRITAVAVGEHLAYEVVQGMVDILVDLRLEDVDGGCRFTFTGTSHPTNPLARLLDWAGAWQLRREMDGQVSNLKKLVEATEH